MELILYTSAFCAPCARARSVLAEFATLVPAASVIERDIVQFVTEAETDGIRNTPTVIVRKLDGSEVFRAVGAPTLNQVLAAAATAL